MMKMFAVAFVLAAAVGCGGGKKADTTPATTETPAPEGTGGDAYGGADTTPADPCAGGDAADPCAGQ